MTTSVVATAFGGPEVLKVIETAVAKPAAGQVLVELKAIGVNPIDYKLYSGAFGADESTLPLPLGSEAAGVVVAVGNTVQGPTGPIAVGDEVIVSGTRGVYADKVLVSADSIYHKPAGLDWNVAAGLGVVAGTAYDTLEVTDVKEGDTVLVHGAAGGVGSIVVQLAKARGARVIGTGRVANHDYIRELGAEPVEYGEGLADRVTASVANGIDVAIDTVGTDEAIDVSLQLVSDKSRIVTIAGFERAAKEGFLSVGGGNPESAARRKKALPTLIEKAASGDYVVTIAKTFPLAEAATAHSELATNHPRGKYVLVP